MKQTCSIHTVNTNHESITVVRHTSPSKGWQALQQPSRSTVAQQTQHRARAPGAESPLSDSFTWSWTAIYLPRPWFSLVGRNSTRYFFCKLLKQNPGNNYATRIKEIEGDLHQRQKETYTGLSPAATHEAVPSKHLGPQQSAVRNRGRAGGGVLKIFITAQTLPST